MARSRSRSKKRSGGAVGKSTETRTSVVRLLGILDLFTPAAACWFIDDLIRAQGMSRSTGYRYVKALNDAELLAAVSNGYYILGPRIIELDRQIRQCDPLYISGGPSMEWLVKKSGHSALLCALFSGSVLCVREELTSESPENIFTRGQRRPLFRGAASKIILAHLRPHQLRNLYAKHSKLIASSGLGANWESFRTALREIRDNGFVRTTGEFRPGVVGISAPIFNSQGLILGSVGITGAENRFKRGDTERVASFVMKAAREITDRIAVLDIGMDRPARAVR